MLCMHFPSRNFYGFEETFVALASIFLFIQKLSLLYYIFNIATFERPKAFQGTCLDETARQTKLLLYLD